MESGRRGKKLRKLGDLKDSSLCERWRKLRVFMYRDDPDMYSYRQRAPSHDSGRRKRWRRLRDLKDSSLREPWRKLRVFMYRDDPDMYSYRQRAPRYDYGRRKRWRRLRDPCHRRKRLIKLRDLAPELGDDILREILYRLPGKSASRFKCVSKRWLGLINNPDCFRAHQARERQPGLLAGLFYQRCIDDGYEDRYDTQRVQFASLCCSVEEEREMKARGLGCLDESLSFLPQPVYIRGCRHGLLLCTRIKLDPDQYYVCNPITKQLVALPLPKIWDIYAATGFFVDQENGHYQVVRIPSGPYPMDDYETVVFVETFSSVTANWRVCKFPISSPRLLPFHHSRVGVQVKETLYWVDAFSRIIAYNVKEDRLCTINLPHCEDCRNYEMVTRGCLGESAGLLRFVFNDGYTVGVWVLQQGKWAIVQTACPYSIHTKVFLPYPLELVSSYSFEPIGFHCLDPQLVFFTTSISGNIFSYHFASQRITMLTSFESRLRVKPVTLFPFLLPQMPFPFPLS